MKGVEDMSGVAGWQSVFPFDGGFSQVVSGLVTIDYVKQLVCVLEPAVELFSGVVEGGEVTEMTARALFFSVNALARCRVALAYAVEVCDPAVDKVSLLEALVYEWDCMVRRECFVEVAYAPSVGAVLGPSVSAIWAAHSLQTVCTARELVSKFPAFVAETRVQAVAQVLVVSERGTPLREMLAIHGDKPMLPADAYRSLLLRAKGVNFDFSQGSTPAVLLEGHDVALDVGYGSLQSEVVAKWLWVLLATFGEMKGYCYQSLYHPTERYHACTVLKQRPVVADVLWHMRKSTLGWSPVDAVIQVGDELHVVSGGRVDLTWLDQYANRRIGMLRGAAEKVEPDYYARALVDEFIRNHKPLPVVPEVPAPLDTAFESLSVSPESSGGREFIDVAHVLYDAVDESVSPRAELGEVKYAAFPLDNGLVSERDSEIVQEIYNRLCDGAVIHESYFVRTYRRFRRLHRRPRMDHSDGRLYHVFEGFPAEGGAGLGPWELDKDWGIPGWQSYTAYFGAGQKRTVSFTVDGGCQDVRMDCTGQGAIELGDCKVRIDGTLLWFTNSIRLCVNAKERVCLRISVPDARSATAMGVEMRRYMHIPGYAVVARSYDVITGSVHLTIPMERISSGSIAGCHVYSGGKYIEGGRCRFKLSQVASLAPARLLFKADPPESLQYVSVCGMRLHPRTRDYVAALVDLRNVEMYVSLSSGARFTVSAAQIVRVKEFELAVVSNAEARAARTFI